MSEFYRVTALTEVIMETVWERARVRQKKDVLMENKCGMRI